MNKPALIFDAAAPLTSSDRPGTPQTAGVPSASCQVEIVVPVKDEETDLAPSIRRLHAYLSGGFPFTAHVTIADNGSTRPAPGTSPPGSPPSWPGSARSGWRSRAAGRALRSIWSHSDCDVLAYMDVDLSTDLNALLPLVAPLLSGHSDVAIGTRLARGSRVVRGPRREVISRGYNLLLQATLGAGFSDAQCGFKAIRRDKARELLPLTRDGGWFFDTELLVLAERAGLRIHEVPVDWTDDPDSRVNVRATALADIRGILRMGGGHRLARFVAVGIASTLAYVLLYLAACAAGWRRRPANAISLLVTAVGNTAVNRRVTFGISGRQHAVRHQLRGLHRVRRGPGADLGRAGRAARDRARGRPGPRSWPCCSSPAWPPRWPGSALYRSWVFRGSAR